ncbi:MAG: 4'-phosphopantetheinyl transferase superfamily protein [Cellulosilyticaceae bacterium]
MELLMTTLNMETDSFEAYMENVPDVIKTKIYKYYCIEDKCRTLLGYTMLRQRLLQNYKVDLKDVKLAYNIYGKPYLNIDTPIYFNISHANNRIICAIDEKEVGVDIERERHIDNILDIAKRFFHEDEYQSLLKQDSTKKQEKYFYQLWTAKESYIKWKGMGLTLPLKSFSVTHQNHETILKTNTGNEACFFKYFNADENYHIHICSSNKKSLDNIILENIRMK